MERELAKVFITSEDSHFEEESTELPSFIEPNPCMHLQYWAQNSKIGNATYLALLLKLCQHHNDGCFLCPDHSPEVARCLKKWTLCGYVLSGALLETLSKYRYQRNRLLIPPISHIHVQEAALNHRMCSIVAKRSFP